MPSTPSAHMSSVRALFLLGLALGPWVAQGRQQEVFDALAPLEEVQTHGCASAVGSVLLGG